MPSPLQPRPSPSSDASVATGSNKRNRSAGFRSGLALPKEDPCVKLRRAGPAGSGRAGSSFVLTAVSSPPELSPSPGLRLSCHPAWLRGLAGRLPSCDVGHMGSLLAPLFIFPGGSDLQGRDYPH